MSSQEDDRGDSGAKGQVDRPSGHSQEFSWNTNFTCFQCSEQERIFVKEEALKDGIEQCERLIDIIKQSFRDIEMLDEGYARSIWSCESRREWIANCERIIDDHRNFNVLVGVSGRTGSGKTSTLNALLGYQELLPTSNEEASTAVPCRIEYNYDDNPTHAFRCHVAFRKQNDLKKQLDEFFETLSQRNVLKDLADRSIDDEQALRDHNAQLKPAFEMIKVVYGIEEGQAEEMDTRRILDTRPQVLALLGTTKKFHHGTAKGISEKIKPYIDSTEADHGKSGLNFAAWPLINQVVLYVKSDILKNGVVLVDLPGAADVVESRAAVAEKYFGQLAATLVVIEAKRAASDSTSLNLMSKQQELATMLNGNFHKRSLCACVSQIDSIDRSAALRKKDAKDNTTLQSWIREEEATKSRKIDKLEQHKREEKDLRSLRTELRSKKRKLQKCKDNTYNEATKKYIAKKARVGKLEHQVTLLGDDLKELSHMILFTCIKARNAYLETRLQAQFAGRQARLAIPNDKKMKEAYDGIVSICPVSAKAFWGCKEVEGAVTGFPEETYSGIPNLANWIRTATIPRREDHVDGILSRLQTQYNIIRLWSKDEWGRSRIKTSRKQFETSVLGAVFEEMKKNFNGFWARLDHDVKDKNPLKGRNASFTECASECTQAVKSWSFANPDDAASSSALHWISYQAMVRRKGGIFISRSFDKVHEYNWMQDLAEVFLNTVVAGWNQALNHDIPSFAKSASPEIDKIWGDFIKSLKMGVETYEFGILLGALQGEIAALEAIKGRVKKDVSRTLKNISRSATNVHPGLVDVARKKWEQGFGEALKEKGTGAHKRRQNVLEDWSRKNSEAIYNAAFSSMQDKLNESFDKLPDDLENISSSAIRDIKSHISVLLEKIIEPTADNEVKLEAVAGMKVEMQHNIKEALLAWDLKWRVSSQAYKFTADMGESKIPDQYPSNGIKLGASYDDDDDDEDEMDVDMGTGSTH
ncbi:hypothetical protein F5Y14DRAFT_462624 [Nemania sp. NC0429]|nr:hypothetical protein F5Y14DRAFT_462624 [Nemania sp. NC0429]